jgi:hypothetical protein
MADTKLESLKAGYLKLSELQTILNVNTHHRCLKWSMYKFLNCAKKLFIEENLPKINCTIYNFKEFMDPAIVDMPPCNTTESAAEMYEFLMEYYNSNFLWESKDSKCPVPCMQTNYNYEINFYSKRSFSDPIKPDVEESKYFDLSVFLTKMEIEERTETLVYDMVSFLSAAGGNLGLFVGFSCLSVIFALIDACWSLIGYLDKLVL